MIDQTHNKMDSSKYRGVNGQLSPAHSHPFHITPTSGVVMGGLAIARVGYGTWWQFVWPLLLLLMILSIVALAGGVFVA